MTDAEARAIARLRDPTTIRVRARRILEAGRGVRLRHFAVDDSRMNAVGAYVADVIRARHPDLDVPIHARFRHFSAGGVDRLATLNLTGPLERARALCDLVVVSVLLDAGSGPAWRYRDPRGGVHARSEGLAVASFDMFAAGRFSAREGDPLRADAARLQSIDASSLAAGFQVSGENPLAGLEGRASLLSRLGHALEHAPHLFAREGAVRPGHLVDRLCASATKAQVPARDVLAAVLEGFSSIWPGRLDIAGTNLGDVWPHPAAHSDDGPDAGLMPFHKLSQWLTYSLVEPLGEAGLQVTDLDELTGLAEYRNGGLLVDLGLIVPRHEGVRAGVHAPGSEIVVEWRALTVALLDEVAEVVRTHLGVADFSLARVLEGGTWAAGRLIASSLRPGGGPPIQVQSDGTVF